MITKLHPFILPDNMIKKMEEQIEKTRITKIEHGFNLCKNNGNIISKDECTGNICEIKLKSECTDQNKTPKIGDFHTHPRGGSDMSLADIRMACRYDLKCIGSIDNSIKCFVKKNIKFPEGCSIRIDNIVLETEKMNKETEMLKRERSLFGISDDELNIRIKLHNEKVRDLIKRRNIIKDRYFKEITVKLPS